MWLLVEDYWHPSYLGSLGYVWLASSSLRSGLDRLKRYLRMLTNAAELQFEESAEEFKVRFNFQDPIAIRYGRDTVAVMLLLTMCRANNGPDFKPLNVTLAQPEPACKEQYLARFRCPVLFDRAATTMTLALAVVNKRLSSANPELARIADQVVINYLAKLDKKDVRSRAMAEILRQLPSGGVTDASVAEALHTNTRTLQRRLKEVGTSFKTLLNDVRMDLAGKYIRDSRLTLTVVSFQLGFSEVSSFSRAYKRWTGKAPSEVRTSL